MAIVIARSASDDAIQFFGGSGLRRFARNDDGGIFFSLPSHHREERGRRSDPVFSYPWIASLTLQ